MDERSLRILEYNKILQRVASYASSPLAKEKIISLQPFEGKDVVESELSKTFEAEKILFDYSISPSLTYDDINLILDCASISKTITISDLLKIKKFLKICCHIKKQISGINDNEIVYFKNAVKNIYTNNNLLSEIEKCVLSETEICDEATHLLKNIRNKIKKSEENIKLKLSSFISSSQYTQFLQENIVTIREGRYVIPLKAENKGKISGLIHDTSASGATIYIEPLVIIELNNDIKQYKIEEKKEIERILHEFTIKISNDVNSFRYNISILTELDVLFAKAFYGNSMNCVRPIINEKGYINIQKGRHPLINKDQVVANDINIGKEFDLLLITGPNTGGKTVSLKTVGIIELMALTGIFVPAYYAEISLFDNIYCDIGDEQSIEQSLSTFSSHMTNIVKIINSFTKDSLILLDELGGGTDPSEGAALGLAIADYILKKGAKAIITTHFNEFKEYAVITPKSKNASIEFDQNNFSPTFRLNIGMPGASNALLISEKIGLKKEILNTAKERLGKQKIELEKVLNSLDVLRIEAKKNLVISIKERDDAIKLKKEAEEERKKLIEQREKLNLSAKKETKKLVELAMDEANEILEQMRQMLDFPTEEKLFKARKLRKSLNNFISVDENEFVNSFESIDNDKIMPGQSVFVKKLNTNGEVLDVIFDKNIAKIKLGNMIYNASLNDLISISSKNETKISKRNVNKPFSNEKISSEVFLIGKNSLDALQILEEFIDKAYRAGLHEIRIIHGYGKGILQKVVINYLKQRKEIESFRKGQYGEGGEGVTVAYFK